MFIHITLALVSLVLTTITLVRPSATRMKASWVLFAATLMSGVGLVFVDSAVLTHVCMSGLVYSVIVLSGLRVASRRLARQ